MLELSVARGQWPATSSRLQAPTPQRAASGDYWQLETGNWLLNPLECLLEFLQPVAQNGRPAMRAGHRAFSLPQLLE